MIGADPLGGNLLQGAVMPGQQALTGVGYGNNLIKSALSSGGTGGIGGALAKVLAGGLGAYMHNGNSLGSLFGGGASPIAVQPGMMNSSGPGMFGMLGSA